ncbi:MAG TPA: hypothetical protein VGA70_06205 [Longimicrobiales bacterium]|jgi:hypothetical protein
MPNTAALPFTLRRSKDTVSMEAIMSTTETVHGLLRLDGEGLTIQWRLARRTEYVGSQIRTDEELGQVRQVAIPLAAVAGAHVWNRWWDLLGPRIVLTAADLRAFEVLTGEGGLRLEHPAEVRLRLRRRDLLLAEEFAAELTLARAQLAVEKEEERPAVRGGRDAPGLPDGSARP